MGGHIVAAGAAGISALAFVSAAAATPPPDDGGSTDFLRLQGERRVAEHFAATAPLERVACEPPTEDAPGVQFLCYGLKADGTVQTAWATLNDDGGIDVAPGSGATPPTSAPPANLGSYQGSGSQVVQVDPITGPTLITVTHDGDGRFAAEPRHGGVPVDTLVFETSGPVERARYLVGRGSTISAFAITADGDWTLTVQPRSAALTLSADAATSGNGPDVITFGDSEPEMLAVTANGPLRVEAITAAGATVLVDAAATFDGSVEVPAGPGFITVDTPGAWSFNAPAGPEAPATSVP